MMKFSVEKLPNFKTYICSISEYNWIYKSKLLTIDFQIWPKNFWIGVGKDKQDYDNPV